ncbi:D-alanyl-lipoteichoic acid acyltransferase DltB (MBOAT superfamily) [Prosthecobacter fusiformis]|uniref:D-alanyl-lipoteichoic acid acyltransferase DltB (MBOAT superfamily) n=1 Tax=Prosthecobacter fusiformis TaxID=48464 RepID=A0A4R7RZA4_9BACT|nr:MBOAT family O-acyltransferase [Prosthecobacter fusiformis]TDU71294.1 D-alanyl-lipoteichoic acid acyltransferase DltB (MBOAT superfamily) [Prosthecobacter fusiformis]
MTFTSWQYALFLPLVVLLYWPLPRLGRMGLLLIASYFFYGMWDLRFLALLMASTGIDYFCARSLVGARESRLKIIATTLTPFLWLGGCALFGKDHVSISQTSLIVAAVFPLLFVPVHEWIWTRPEESRRRSFMWLSILTNLAVLGFFKYFGFFADSLVSLLGAAGIDPGWTLPNIILPVAISFYTFQSVAYAVDVYKGKVQPAPDLLTFSAYLAFFPQLVAGPIERPAHFMPQFTRAAVWEWDHLHAGLRLLLIGAFKKVFVADNCAIVANYVFNPGATPNAPWALLGIIAFAFQIYGDFSGYTDLARGSARLLGIHLSMNFRFPYLATGPSDFWQRWHITLSSWFRDYVYIPLGGNRSGLARTIINLWITMLLAGLWHGASWTFVLWGGYHAAMQTAYRLIPGLASLEKATSGGKPVLAVCLMFILTLFGWAIFRAQTMPQLGVWLHALTDWTRGEDWTKPALWLLFHIVPLILLQLLTLKPRDEAELTRLPWVARGLVFFLLFAAFVSSVATEQEFIYFQF